MIKIQELAKTIKNLNDIKRPEVPDVDIKNPLIRFFDYIEKECGIKSSIQSSDLKKILFLMKDITTGCAPVCNWTKVTFGRGNEYDKLFKRFENTETFGEFIISKSSAHSPRVFGFYTIDPFLFNIVLISDRHIKIDKR